MTDKEQALSIDNFNKLFKSNILDNFIQNVSSTEEHSILGVCKYILSHKREWNKLVKELQPFLKDYGLAYEDIFDLNIVGENFVIEYIYYDIFNEDIYEYNMAVFGQSGGTIYD